jgi:hypothetical protein
MLANRIFPKRVDTVGHSPVRPWGRDFLVRITISLDNLDRAQNRERYPAACLMETLSAKLRDSASFWNSPWISGRRWDNNRTTRALSISCHSAG